jgi:hypothetical protein
METASITLRNTVNHERWVRLALSLGADLPAGRASFISKEFPCDVKGLSQVASDDSKNWGFVILSGARYVFSALKVPHKEIVVHSLEGFLDEEDTSGISHASAICLLTLLKADASKVEMGHWQKTNLLCS